MHPVKSLLAALSSTLVLFACASAPPPAPPPKKEAIQARLRVPPLEANGRLITVPIEGTAEVAFRAMFLTGSVDDPKGKEGLTALTARLMAEGGTRRLSYPELLRALYPMASNISVQVEKEQTVFLGSVHPDKAEEFITLLAEVLMTPRLDEADLERIRQVLLSDLEKRLKAVDDENLGKEALGSMLFPAPHPYHRYDGGTVKGLSAITIDDVEAHVKRVFGRQRLILGAAGAVSEEIGDKLESAFAELPLGEPRLASIEPVAKPKEHHVLIVEKPAKAIAISLGFAHDAFRGHPDFSALALVQSHLGEHRQFHGVLMSEMRERRGLNYGDYAYVEKFIQEGWSRNALTNVARRQQHFEIWIRPVDPADAIFALRLALFYLERLQQNGLTEEEVRSAATFLTGYTRLWDLTPSRRLGYALDDAFYGIESYLEGYRADLATLDAASVKRAIAAHLVSPGLEIVFVAPDGEALKKALLEGAPSTKTYPSAPPAGVLEDDAKVSVRPLGLKAENIRVVKAAELFKD